MKPMMNRRLREETHERFVIDLNMPESYPPIPARRTEEGGVRDRFLAAMAELPDEVTVVRPFHVDAFAHKTVLYVAEDGCDTAAGTESAPLATLAEAVKRAEGKGGVKIVLLGGNYNLTEPVRITSAHSGTEETPLVITAAPDEVPYLSASAEIPASAFVPVTDEAKLARLSEAVRDKIVCADLPSVGITEFGKVGWGEPVLMVNNLPQTLARYPNKNEPLIPLGDVIYDADGTPCTERGKVLRGDPWEIGVTDPRPFTWQWDDDIWLFGAFYAEWWRRYEKIGAFDREKNSIRGAGPATDGVRIEHGNNYYFLNVFEELDEPGEWYLDRSEGKLYFYPPEEGLSDTDDIRFIAKPCSLIECSGAENVILDRLDAGRCAGTAFSVKAGRQVLIQRCHITGTCRAGADSPAAVEIHGGFRNGIIASVIEHFTNSAAAIGGGDRLNLIPANNFMQNCAVINPHYRHGVSSGGCGNIVSHNYIRDTTMGDCGHNEGVIEYNVIEGGDTETHDSGMIYVAGGGCSCCGNHYRYNYIFDFKANDYGIYFDDLSRGMYAYGNIVVGNGANPDGSWDSGGRSYNVHNGGEHCFFNNISIDAGYFAFGGDITYYLFDANWFPLYQSMVDAAADKRTETYMGRNPTYRDFVEALDEYTEDRKNPDYVRLSGWAENRLRKPWCNHYENNVIIRAARAFKLDNGDETATGLDTNFITDGDPGFADFSARDYRIRPDAPLYAKIPDFVPPPFEKMGLVDDFGE